MLPDQPFYFRKRRFQLSCGASARYPGRMAYYRTFENPVCFWSHATYGFVHLTRRPEQTSVDGTPAIMTLYRRGCQSLPFTMVNLTHLFYRCKTSCFTLRFDAIPANVELYLDEVRRVTEKELLDRMKVSAPYVYKREGTAALVQAHLADGMASTGENLQVSLACPLAQTRIHVPSRGVRCRHVQCFDAFAYLGCNEATTQPAWCCPVFHGQILVQDLRVALLTLDILSVANDQKNIAAVVQASGSWSLVTEDNYHGVSGVHDNSSKVEASLSFARDVSVMNVGYIAPILSTPRTPASIDKRKFH